MHRCFRSMSLALLVAAFTASSAWSALGKVAGVVEDAAGKPMVGVVIKVEELNKGATTDAEGRYFILNLPPGALNITASIIGYRSQTKTGVTVASDATTPLSFSLETAPVAMTGVTVVAVRPPVDRTLTSTRTVISAAELNNALPLDGVADLAETAAGVFKGGIRGGQQRETKIMLDGINVSDPYFAGNDGQETKDNGYTWARRSSGSQSSMSLNTSSVQEVTVLAGTYNAEYDAASAGLINVTTRDGGSTLSVDEFFRTSVGGLAHQGPDVYNNGIADSLASDAVAYMRAKGAATAPENYVHDFDTSGIASASSPYSYGEKPTMANELSIGGPIGSDHNFFLTNRYYNSYGRFPGEFTRSINTSLKLNHNVSESLKLTLFGQLDDGGGLLGWNNRVFTQKYKFYSQGNPANHSLGWTSYASTTHVMSAQTFVEIKVSSVGNNSEIGYADVSDMDAAITVNQDRIALDGDGDFLKLTPGSNGEAKKYIDTGYPTPFDPEPGNPGGLDVNIGGFPYRIGNPGYYYESLDRSQFGVRADLTSQVNYNNLVKLGVQYKRLTISQERHRTLLKHNHSGLGFQLTDFTLNPQEYALYIQDRIEYQGIVVNAGLRLDGFDYGAKDFGDLFAPTATRSVAVDTTGDGVTNTSIDVAEPLYTKDIDTKWYISPRLGVSHPISDKAAMHYSWAKLVNPPLYSYIFDNYNESFGTGVPSLPSVRAIDQRPVQATAYELGLQLALSDLYTADVTAFYRDTENTGRSGFSVTPEVGYSDIGAWKSYTLQTDGGGAESRGVELTVSKALSPQAKMIDFGGRVAYAFSSVRAKAGGGGAANKNGYSANSDGIVNLGVRDDYDWVLKRRQASGSDFGVETGFDRTHRINAVLQAAFPFGLSLATTIEGASGFLYDITTASDVDPRERQVGEAPWTWQADLRVEDTQKLGSVSATVFVEIRNLLDRENILTWDGGTNPDVARQIWEDTHNPHGNLNRATRSEGTPIYDIAREMYAGVRVSF